jgi:endonuclease/exonuclease/phosphatase family metal-dependent hydrolase
MKHHLAATLVASLWLAAPHAVSAQDATLQVMSFNVRLGVVDDGDDSWEHRKDLLLETVQAFDPDLLGTQETYDFQAQHLLDGLGGYEYVGWPRQPDSRDGEQCGILFRTARFEKKDAGQFWLSETPDVPGSRSWDAAFPRIVTWVRLWDRERDAELVFLNTHFDHRGVEARARSARALRAYLLGLEPAGDWILTGDFNTPEGSEPYVELVGDGPVPEPVVTDTYRAAHPEREEGEGTMNGFTGERSGGRIDWILHGTGFETLAAEIDRTQQDGRYPSDHFPVTAVLRWRD